MLAQVYLPRYQCPCFLESYVRWNAFGEEIVGIRPAKELKRLMLWRSMRCNEKSPS